MKFEQSAFDAKPAPGCTLDMLEGDLSLRQYLLDSDFWLQRLDQLALVPRRLVICPRQELCRAGIEVLELRLQAHDGTPIRALLGRSSFARKGSRTRLRPAEAADPDGLDWLSLEQGTTDVALSCPAGRRLEDRVLDVLRGMEAVCGLESVPAVAVELGWGRPAECEDAFTLAAMIRDRGWLPTPNGHQR